LRRKNLITLLLAALVCLSFTHSARYHRVKFVYDGDTILIDTGEKVRYLGIDTPEIGHEGKKSQFMAFAARNFNRQLVGDALVRLEFDREKKDHYGRTLAYVFLENGEMVNAAMIRKGYAHVLLKWPNFKYRSLLLAYQREAMRKRIGIWRYKTKKPEPYYIGSSSSYRFHRPSCPFAKKIPPHHIVRFSTRYQAFWEGFSPCRECNP